MRQGCISAILLSAALFAAPAAHAGRTKIGPAERSGAGAAVGAIPAPGSVTCLRR